MLGVAGAQSCADENQLGLELAGRGVVRGWQLPLEFAAKEMSGFQAEEQGHLQRIAPSAAPRSRARPKMP